MKSITSKFRYLLAVLILLAESSRADFPNTELEFAQLPPYCKARFSGSHSSYFRLWDKKLGGKNFIHMHHYCSGLNGINKAYFLKEPFKGRMLTSALGGIDYVLERAEKDFYLFPEMHLKKGEIYVLMKEHPKAISEFRIAIELNPKYIPPYYHLARLYNEIGNKEEAVKTLETGLDINPNSKLLRKTLKTIKK